MRYVVISLLANKEDKVKILSRILSGSIALSVLVVALMAYMMRTADIKNHKIYDGLGRELTEPPIWAQLFITSEHSWAGLGWHVIDIIWFFGGLFIAYKIYEYGDGK